MSSGRFWSERSRLPLASPRPRPPRGRLPRGDVPERQRRLIRASVYGKKKTHYCTWSGILCFFLFLYVNWRARSGGHIKLHRHRPQPTLTP